MSFSTNRYLIMTTDPVHIGTGGMRLGRVDNSIVREPGTRLPKIPGTSLSGAIRSYAAYRYGKRRCAGQGQPQDGREGHCGRPTCPICYTFGSIRGERSYSGVVSIGDARLLLFPVYSMAGPVWVSTPGLLKEAGFNQIEDALPLTTMSWDRPLNLGWLMIEKPNITSIEPLQGLREASEWKTIENRIVLISEKLFSQVVNSNLEVRTSVSINPETGAAEYGALFTYEAIPRSTFLWFDAFVDDYRSAFPSKQQLESWKEKLAESNECAHRDLVRKWHLWSNGNGDEILNNKVKEAQNWVRDDLEHYRMASMPAPEMGWKKDLPPDELDAPQNVISAGLEWANYLGIGGMGTRGFGRIRTLAKCCIDMQTQAVMDCHSPREARRE